MPAITATWTKVATSATQFALQNTGTALVLVRAVATGGTAPANTDLDGFQVMPNELLPLTSTDSYDIYASAPNGASTYWIQHDGS